MEPKLEPKFYAYKRKEYFHEQMFELAEINNLSPDSINQVETIFGKISDSHRDFVQQSGTQAICFPNMLGIAIKILKHLGHLEDIKRPQGNERQPNWRVDEYWTNRKLDEICDKFILQTQTLKKFDNF